MKTSICKLKKLTSPDKHAVLRDGQRGGSSECGRAWTAGKRGQRASMAARPSASSSASRRARPHARAQPAGGTAGAEARRRRGRATCANGERSLRRCGQRVRRVWPARRRGLNGRAGRVQDEPEGRAEEGVAGLAGCCEASRSPNGFEGWKSLGYEKIAAGPQQPRSLVLRGERAGYVNNPPRLQLDSSRSFRACKI